jgi:hypothetical protein
MAVCTCFCWRVRFVNESGGPVPTFTFKYKSCETGLDIYVTVPPTTPYVDICSQGLTGMSSSFPQLISPPNIPPYAFRWDPANTGYTLVNCSNPADSFVTSIYMINLNNYVGSGKALQLADRPGCWYVASTGVVCYSDAQPVTITTEFASCVECLDALPCYLLTNCNPLAVPATIITSTDLFLNLSSVVTLVDLSGCWTVSASPTCEGSIPVTVIQSYTNCETCTQEYVTFVSCCGGFELHFVRNLVTVPTYLVNNTVYVYNGSLYTDGINTMYPGQCYTYKNTFSSSLLPTFAVPPFVSFTSTSVTTGNCANVVTLCDHCFYKLTNCDIDNDVIYTYTDLSQSVGEIITITGYPKICWIVSESDTAILPVVVTPVGINYKTCLDCKGYFFTINDCCTDEPYLVNNVPLVLEYHGDSNPGFSPVDLSTQIITTINLANGNSITGCFYIVDITTAGRSSVAQSQIVVDWDTDLEFVTVPTCEDCQSCKTCYLLTNCVTGEVEYITGTDLIQYIGGVITIKGCKDQCWIVTQAENCDGCGGAVTVLSYFPNTDPAVGKICTYTLTDINFTITSGTIVIDGVTYPLVITSFSNLITSINALGLGTAYISTSGTNVLIGIVGDYVYGSICLIGNDDGTPITNCFTPVCTNYINNCTYSVLTLIDSSIPDRNVTITINGIVHTTLLTSANISKLLIWLNSLGLGFFTANIVGANCTIQVFGNATYGNIVIDSEIVTTLTTTCTTITSNPCDLCLPQPIPEPPVVLNTRFVKPGYSTPSCSPEYTERVNCNYGDQLYNRMLSVRYGLTVCCDEAFDKWLIKKELLDLTSLKNTEFDCCPPIAPCNVCNTQECCCVVIPVLPVEPCSLICYSAQLFCDNRISCTLVYADCNNTFEYIIVLPGESLNTYICSSILPTFSSNNIITPLLLDCAAGDCAAPLPCVTTCYKVTFSYTGLPTLYNYFNCATGMNVRSATTGGTLYICSGIIPIGPSITNVVALPNDCAAGLCVAPPPCFCWSFNIPKQPEPLQFTYDTCDGIPVTINGVYNNISMCSPVQPMYTGGLAFGINSGVCFADCGILESPVCQCYIIEVTSSDASIADVDFNIYPCDLPATDIKVTSLSGPAYGCFSFCPIIVTSTPNAIVTITIRNDLDCTVGECVAPPPLLCVCYVINTDRLTVIDYTDCEGNSLSLPVEAGSFSICSLTVPTTDVPAEKIETATPCNLCI